MQGHCPFSAPMWMSCTRRTPYCCPDPLHPPFTQELPAELGSLPALAQLDARHNQLTALPPALGDAGALNELRVGFNQLASLPGTLGMLRSLRTLDCRNNLITVSGCYLLGHAPQGIWRTQWALGKEAC